MTGGETGPVLDWKYVNPIAFRNASECFWDALGSRVGEVVAYINGNPPAAQELADLIVRHIRGGKASQDETKSIGGTDEK